MELADEEGGGDIGRRPEADWEVFKSDEPVLPTRGSLKVPISLAEKCKCFTT